MLGFTFGRAMTQMRTIVLQVPDERCCDNQWWTNCTNAQDADALDAVGVITGARRRRRLLACLGLEWMELRLA